MPRSPVDFTQQEFDLAGEILGLSRLIVVKLGSDHTGSDLRPEVWHLQELLEQGGIDLKDAIELEIEERVEASPRDRLTELYDLVEAMLHGMRSYETPYGKKLAAAALANLRSGDFTALLQNEPQLNMLVEAVGLHERDTADVEQFYHFLLFLSRTKAVLQDGIVMPGGTYADAALVDYDDDDDDEDDDEEWDVGEPG